MARPVTSKADQRGERLNLRLTPAERLTVEANAAFLGVSPSEYGRRCILAKKMPASRAEQQTTAVRSTALIRIGNNLNQLARHANAGKGLLESELRLTLSRINAELDRLYDPAPH